MMAADVIVNEIMYHPINAANPTVVDTGEEYIELYNRGNSAANLTNWHFDKGIDYTFPGGSLAAGDYLVVAADLTKFSAKYPGVSNVVGPWTHKLSNSGETIELVDSKAATVDSVSYANQGDWADRRRGPLDSGHRGWIWTSPADGGGSSLELVNPALTNNQGQNWAASTVNDGTPGAANSVLSADIAPMILDLTQTPLIPKSTDAVTITAHIVDELGTTTSAAVHWRLDSLTPPSFTSLAMRDDGAGGDVVAGDGIWTAVIPAQADNKVVEFYLSATDGTNARTWPAPSDAQGTQGANLLYQVDNTPYTGTQPLFKIIMAETERVELESIGNGNGSSSNAQMNATFISIDPTGAEVRYTSGVRNRGGGSRVATVNNYHVLMPTDRPWKGVSAFNLNGEYSMQDVAGSAVIRAAGLPTQNVIPVQVRVNNANLASTTQFDMFGSYSFLEAENSDMVDGHFPTDTAGNYYRAVDAGHNAKLTYLGATPSSYYSLYPKQTNVEINDYTDLINLTKAFSAAQTPDAAFVQTISQNINITEWLRYFAANTLIGNIETALATGFGDDYSLYSGGVDPRFQVVAHDLDTILGRGDSNARNNIAQSIFWAADGGTYPDGYVSPGVPAVKRLLENPAFAPLYYAQIKDLIDTTFSATNIGAILDNTLSGYVPQSAIDGMKTFAAGRVANVLTQIPQTLTATSASTVQNGYPRTTTSTTSLTGKADAIRTRSILVDGQPAAWTAYQASWSAPSVSLRKGINRVLIQALDENGQEFQRTYIDIWYDAGTSSNVSGTLPAGTTTWTAANSPYHVTANLVVPATATLVIQPGVTVFFDAGVGMTVNGKITAVGTDLQRIRFTKTPTAASAWNDILVSNTQADSKIAYADQDFAGSGGQNIQVNSARLDIDHVTWMNTTTQIVNYANSAFRLTNSVLPNTVNVEPAHFAGMPANGYALVQGNIFGTTTGHNDIFDFTGGNRPGPIFQILDNIFTGTGTGGTVADDILDVDGTDAHVEGNVFMNVATSPIPDTNSAISGGADSGNTSQVVSVRNFFYNVDHAFLMKEGNSISSINDTMVHVITGVFNFFEPGFDLIPGAGGFADGDIFFDIPSVNGTPVIVQNPPVNPLVVRHTITPSAQPIPGIGNLNLDPHLLNTVNVLDPRVDFILRQGPGPAVGTGPNGLDMGAAVPGGASIAGEPSAQTFLTDATLTVGGPDIYAYRYRVNNGAFSADINTVNAGTVNASVPAIQLTGLIDGSYTVFVVRKNSAGFWQPDNEATVSKTWTVNVALPPHLRINEVLAQNVSAVNHNGTFPDIIELYNDGQGTADLSGMSISDDPLVPRKFVFPANTTLDQGQYLVLYANKSDGTPGIHVGFSLDADGESVHLYDTLADSGTEIDSVVFGKQLDNLSIGRRADGSWGLATPTFGAANTPLPQGDPHLLKINEWLASPIAPFTSDFVELYNPDSLPVDLGGFYLTDNPVGWANEYHVPPLTFAAGKGFFTFFADAQPTQGSNHTNFKLSADQGTIGLFDATQKQIDAVIYATQRPGISQGRTPDGGPIFAFFTTPNPGVSNPAVVVTTQTLNLIGITDTWHYNQSRTDLLTTWRNVGYNDNVGVNSWLSGPALFYNETAALPAPKSTPLNLGPANDDTPTFYFRKHFNLSVNPSAVTSLLLETVLDDGAIVYLNGTKVFSLGIPTGTISYSTYTGTGTGGRNVTDAVYEGPFILPTAALLQGDNVLAVEVHQSSNTSSDVVWGATLSATVTVAGVPTPSLRVTELNYNPPGGGGLSGDDYEFIEIKNTSAAAINMAGVHFGAGVNYTFPNISLATGAHVVIAKNPAAFTARYGTGINLAGQYTDDLDNNGEEIRLLDVNNSIIQDFTYSSSWYPSTDNTGYTLNIINPSANANTWSDPASWQPSKFVFGSPGIAESVIVPESVVVNEILTNSDLNPDWIELHNTTNSPIDISGWYLTDSAGNLLKFHIPQNTVIAANDYVVFTEDSDFGNINNPNAIVPFAFGQSGDDVYLSSSSAPGVLSGYHQGLSFGAADVGVTFGRYTTSTGQVDFTALSTPTKGSANAYPLVGPVVINELMYHPAGGGNSGEFIELRNITAQTISLFDPANTANTWQFTNGVTFTFPQGVSLVAHQNILVVATDPATFRSTYNIPASVPIYGPYTGALGNSGETVALSKPGLPDPITLAVPYILVDQVQYGTSSPWPTAPDGNGPSLSRITDTSYANDPVNWTAGPNGGSPGQDNSGSNPNTITGTDSSEGWYLRLNSDQATIDVFENTGPGGIAKYTFPINTPSAITFNGLGGNDQLTIDFTNGNPLPGGGLFFNGGGEIGIPGDSLAIIGAAGDVGSYAPSGTTTGDGVVTVNGRNIVFTGLEPVSATGFGSFSLVTPNSDDALTLDTAQPGRTELSGTSGGVSFEALTFFNVANVIIDTAANDPLGNGDDSITINDTSATGLASLKIIAGAGDNTLTLNGGTTPLDASASPNLKLVLNNTAIVNLAASQSFTSLAINDTAHLTLAANGNFVLRTSALSIASAASLDLADNDLILQSNSAGRAAALASLSQLIASARKIAPWAGPGITSSAAAANPKFTTGLAIALNDNGHGGPLYGSFDGLPVDLNSVLVKYTWNGDADLSGKIDADDYFQIDAGFAQHLAGYRNGDFDFNGKIDADDYFLIDSAFVRQSSVLATVAPLASRAKTARHHRHK
jgi:hypothetical protein